MSCRRHNLWALAILVLAGCSRDTGDFEQIKRWVDDHPEARPLHMVPAGMEDPRSVGIEYNLPNSCSANDTSASVDAGPQPGWYVIPQRVAMGESMMVFGRKTLDGTEFAYFRVFEPIERIGHYHLYHLSSDEVDAVRHGMGFDTPAGDAPPEGSRKVASLMHIFLRLQGQAANLVTIEQHLNEGTSLFDIVRCFEALGLRARLVAAQSETIPETIPLPAITFMGGDPDDVDGKGRFVIVLTGLPTVTVIDPAGPGYARYSQSEYSTQATGYLLIVE